MVGLGGGFVVVPVLRLFFGLDPAFASGTSLALVVANSGSAAFTYTLQGRVHMRVGLLLSAAAFPASILGAMLVKRLPANWFDVLFALFITAIAIDILRSSGRRLEGRHHAQARATALAGMRWYTGLAAGFAVGFISSLFGVGGGVVLIPSLIYLSDLPAHAITATSHFAIFLTSPVGLAAHYVQRDIDWNYVVPLVAGGLLGGPIGARLSLRVHSPRLMGFVAVALVAAAVALVARHVFG